MKDLLLYLFYQLIVRPWLTLIIGVRFSNRQVFDNVRQFIVVANHNSHFDMVSIMAALPWRKLKNTRGVAAADYFGKTSFSARLMNFFFHAILIERHRKEGAPSAIEILDRHLKEGRSLVLFPEGTRGQAGVIADFKKGVAILLKDNPGIPFIPVYLDGFGRVLPKDKWLIIPLVCKVRFGEPVYPAGQDVDEILEKVRDAIFKLKDKDERDRNVFDYK